MITIEVVIEVYDLPDDTNLDKVDKEITTALDNIYWGNVSETDEAEETYCLTKKVGSA